MSKGERTSRWGNRVLNLALLLLGVMVMALLYALVSQSLGIAGSPSSAPPASAEEKGAPPVPPDDIIQVGVRNGCGEPGLAAEARGYLVRHDFDVVEVGNYSSFDLDSSFVIDRVGNLAAARRVARALGIPERRVRQDVGSQYHLDASVILGSDYAALTPFRDESDDRTVAR